MLVYFRCNKKDKPAFTVKMAAYRLLFITVIVLSLGFDCHAQLVMSEGIGLCYPEVYTGKKMINSGLIGFGASLGAAYEPENLQFFPGLKLGYGRLRLPLQESGNNVAALIVNQYSSAGYEHFIPDIAAGRHFLISGGIGISYLVVNGAAPSGNQVRETSIDSTANIRRLFPEMDLALAYCFHGRADERFYVTLELNVQYVLLLSGYNTYYVTVAEPGNNIYHYQSSLSSNLVTPLLSIVIHDRIMHRKK